MSGAADYLEMERAFYADLVARSDFSSEAFTRQDVAELVVGSYVQHECVDYEGHLLGGVRVAEGAIALEYGCGPGRMIRRFANRFARVDGVDISPEVLEVARTRCADLRSRPRLLLTDGQGLPQELDAAYDVAFSVICLQHISVYSLRRRIFSALFGALKPGGVLTFQMGYGPGHQQMVDYFADAVDVSGTNGVADVGVLHPAEIGGDLDAIGFTSLAYKLAPTGPGDTHGAWIFVRAVKPVSPTRPLAVPSAWRRHGFLALEVDEAAAAESRQRHQQRGLLARYRQGLDEIAGLGTRIESLDVEMRAHLEAAALDAQDRRRELEEQRLAHARAVDDRDRELRRLENAFAMAGADRDLWRDRAAAGERAREFLHRKLEMQERKLNRLRVADRRRVHGLVADLVRAAGARHLRVGLFGAGGHTAWLFRETPIGEIADLVLFDPDPSRISGVFAGRPVHPAEDIPSMRLDVIVVSSLGFQDEMAAYLESLRLEGTHIVRCYP